MNLTPFEASKVIDWVEHVLTNGIAVYDKPRGIGEVQDWLEQVIEYRNLMPFPKFDTEQPYTWEG